MASWLSGKDYRSCILTEARATYAAAMNGESGIDPDETDYGRLIVRATEIASAAATEGWANPDAFVSVDISE